MKRTTIALVDDHRLFREGVSGLLKEHSGFEVILSVSGGTELMQKLDPKKLPDIAVLDINMKDMDGIDVAKWLKENHPSIKILALTMLEDEATVIRMMRAGARGYLLKGTDHHVLIEALMTLMTKGYYTTDLITGSLIHAINRLENPTPTDKLKELITLSSREIEFLKWVCTELSYKEIAANMKLSPSTIDGYRDALFEKLGAKSRTGLVVYAIKNKIFLVE